MLFQSFFTTAVAVLPLLASASPVPDSEPASYCPSTYCPDSSELAGLFDAFTAQVFSGDVAGAFAKYVDPNITEHSTAGTNYGADVGFLSLLIPTVTIHIIAGIQGCFGDICGIHYSATPIPGDNSLITNITSISDWYRYDGTCIAEHWDSVQTADGSTLNPLFPGVWKAWDHINCIHD